MGKLGDLFFKGLGGRSDCLVTGKLTKHAR